MFLFVGLLLAMNPLEQPPADTLVCPGWVLEPWDVLVWF